MKCLICSGEIDEFRDFIVEGPQGQKLDDAVNRLRHVAELAKWTHVSLTAQKWTGTEALLSGHVCPAHVVAPGRIALVVAPAQSSPSASPTPKKDK